MGSPNPHRQGRTLEGQGWAGQRTPGLGGGSWHTTGGGGPAAAQGCTAGAESLWGFSSQQNEEHTRLALASSSVNPPRSRDGGRNVGTVLLGVLFLQLPGWWRCWGSVQAWTRLRCAHPMCQALRGASAEPSRAWRP